MQTTHTEVQDGHERPALSLREITCIVILFFGGGTLLTQISSTYKIIVSALTVPVTSSTHLLSECQYCRYRKLNAGCSLMLPYSPQSYITPAEAATVKPKPMLDRDVV